VAFMMPPRESVHIYVFVKLVKLVGGEGFVIPF